MLIHDSNLQELKLKNRKLFGKLKRGCYNSGFMKHACVIETHLYHAYWILNEKDQLLSWCTVTRIRESDNLVMIWTPIRMRGKGYASQILEHLSDKYGVYTLSFYENAEPLVLKMFKDKHKALYESTHTPDEFTKLENIDSANLYYMREMGIDQ